MKYVVFEFAAVYMPVIVPEHVIHSQIHLEKAKPVSAGFLHIDGFGTVHVHGESESLKLKPHPRDKQLLQNVIDGFGTMHFLKDIVDK